MIQQGPATITRLELERDQNSLWHQVDEIFFEAAQRRNFISVAARTTFREQWLGYYQTEAAGQVYLAISDNGQVMGYLTGCLDSAAAARLFRDLPHYALFAERFAAFPAHLHINCRADARSRGLGSRLVEAFCADCQQQSIAGVHVVTAADARNAAFYRRLAFNAEETRGWQGRDLLFLGRKLG